MNDGLRRAEPLGVLNLADIGWHLRVYLMRGNPTESIDRDELFSNLSEKVRLIEHGYLSSEFSYIRSGFAIAHYGRRGVTYTIWHWADWNGTWECFSHAWYCYHRETARMEPLERSEPAFCHHELKVVATEGRLFLTICSRHGGQNDIVDAYRGLCIDADAITN